MDKATVYVRLKLYLEAEVEKALDAYDRTPSPKYLYVGQTLYRILAKMKEWEDQP